MNCAIMLASTRGSLYKDVSEPAYAKYTEDRQVPWFNDHHCGQLLEIDHTSDGKVVDVVPRHTSERRSGAL